MKQFLLSDSRDTLVAMRLAGIKGVLTESTSDAEMELDELLKNKEIGILLISEKLAEAMREKIDAIKEKSLFPLIVEIPDRHGSIKDPNYILNYVKESVGI